MSPVITSILMIAAVLCIIPAVNSAGEPGVETDSAALSSADDALDHLISRLMADSAYVDEFYETSLFMVEYEDSLTMPGDSSHYFNISIREKHEPGGPGDPVTAPVRDRFRIYTSGRILYWSALPGMYIEYSHFLEGWTEL